MVKSTGDGHLATFDGPTQAIRCAEALRADAETLGIQIRTGIHTGECELLDTDIGGIAVHIAARILGQAGAGEILVSRTVRDLVVGSGTGFEDRGSVELRGVPGTWQLLAVDRHGRAGRIGRGGTGGNAHPRTADRDAAVGSCRGGDGQAHTVDSARDGPPRPGHPSQLNSCAWAGPGHFKRILRALAANLERYEQTYGSIPEAAEPAGGDSVH